MKVTWDVNPDKTLESVLASSSSGPARISLAHYIYTWSVPFCPLTSKETCELRSGFQNCFILRLFELRVKKTVTQTISIVALHNAESLYRL